MKNLQTLKKFAAIVVSAMMVLSTLALPTFAAENKVATIKGVEDGADVVAYQFVEQNPQTYKWKPLAWVGGTELSDKSGFTFKLSDDGEPYTYYYESTDYGSGDKDNKPALEALALKARTTTPAAVANVDASTNIAVTFTQNSTTKDYTGTLPNLGSYVVIVDSNNTTDDVTVYSPMVVSMAYGKAEGDTEYTMQAGSFTVANAKKSNVSFDKNIKVKEDSTSNPKDHQGGNANVKGNGIDDNSKKGDTLKPGDKTTFQITAQAPKYSEDFFVAKPGYTGPFVKITDKLDGLTLCENPNFVIKFNGATLDSSKYTLTVDNDNKGFTFLVDATKGKDVLKTGGSYIIEYDAVLDETATSGFDANTNTATYEYTRKPGVDGEGNPYTNKEEEITYHYTFDIDGDINGYDEGHEIIKVGIDNYTGELVLSEENFETQQKPLEGAVFELKKGSTVVAVAESAADGRLKAIPETSENYKTYKTGIESGDIRNGLTKLDCGDYNLYEVKAPEGYDKYPEAIPVVISAKLYNDVQTTDDGTVLHRYGMLESYSVKVNNKDTNTYTWTNDSNKTYSTVYKYWDYEAGEEKETTDYNEFLSMATNIVNTDLGTLPSTGGMGTVLFTVGGIAIMGLALLLLFGGKKKQEQK